MTKQKQEEISNANQMEFKLSHSHRNMVCLIGENKLINQRSIAKLMNISSQAVSETIKKLEQLDLIEKTIGTQNNENLIKLTEKGERRAALFSKHIKQHADEAFKNFTEDEKETFYNLLEKLIN
ncbi:MAG: MarR family transcriptional regulator [Clostridia bacterium]